MRVVSLVPSITETLLSAGVSVVGRTRYCVHPRETVNSIEIVGGTKDLNQEKLSTLKPDLLILDKEENLKWMKESAPCRVYVSHVTSLETAAEMTGDLAKILNNQNLFLQYERWKRVLASDVASWNWQSIPGHIFSFSQEKTKGLDQNTETLFSEVSKIYYIIWRNPWMTVSAQTYIGDVLKKLGAASFLDQSLKGYPSLSDEVMRDSKNMFLFSSEPYPFGKYQTHLPKWASQGALVDGESFSWFGLRGLAFLEKQLGITE